MIFACNPGVNLCVSTFNSQLNGWNRTNAQCTLYWCECNYLFIVISSRTNMSFIVQASVATMDWSKDIKAISESCYVSQLLFQYVQLLTSLSVSANLSLGQYFFFLVRLASKINPSSIFTVNNINSLCRWAFWAPRGNVDMNNTDVKFTKKGYVDCWWEIASFRFRFLQFFKIGSHTRLSLFPLPGTDE